MRELHTREMLLTIDIFVCKFCFSFVLLIDLWKADGTNATIKLKTRQGINKTLTNPNKELLLPTTDDVLIFSLFSVKY